MSKIVKDGVFRLVSSETVPLTKELVKRMAGLKPAQVERPLEPKRVDYLDERRTLNRLVPFNWSIVKWNGTEYRMNGQHSSCMLARLDGNLPEGLFAHLDVFEVETEADMITLFRQFDPPKSVRSSSDVCNAFQCWHPALKDVDYKVGQKILIGIAFFRKSIMGYPGCKAEDVGQLYNEEQYHPFIKWVAKDFFGVKELHKTAVIAAMYATWEVDAVDAAKFWGQVADPTNNANDSAPVRMLSSELLATRDKDRRKRLYLKPIEVYSKCILSWRAFRADVTNLRTLKWFKDKGIPEAA